MRVLNKVALVTGGGGGLGEAICRRLAEEGATVIVADINEAEAQRVAESLQGLPGKAVFRQQDVTCEALWPALLGEIVSEFGQLDVLVNNAGIAAVGSAESETLAQWRKIQAVNSDAVFLGTREAIKLMKTTGGSIINISSIEGIIGEPLAAAYNASKGAVRILTKSAALWCCQEKYPVRVNSLHPGYVMTGLVKAALASVDKATAENFVTRIMDSIPMGRMADPREIANGVLFLASDESSYMTGSELVIDGGYTAK